MSYPHNLLCSQKGFTLLESMVALLILSVGLLGVAGLQSLGLKMNSDAMQRTQASILAYDIAEKLRMDPDESYDSSSAYFTTFDASELVEGAVCDETSVTVSSTINCWKVFLDKGNIPTGKVTISAQGDENYPQLCPDAGNALESDEIGVEIQWSDNWLEQGLTADNMVEQSSCQTFVFNVRKQ